MARQFRTPKVFSAGVMTGTNTIDSLIVDMSMFDIGGLEIQIATGTAAGSFKLMVSNSYDPANNPGAVFIDVATLGTGVTPALPVPAGAPLSYLGGLSTTFTIAYRYIKLRYTNTSGSGLVDAWFNFSGAA